MAPSTVQNWSNFLKRLPSLFLGLFVAAVGLVAILHANLGVDPWGVLHVGVANITPLTIGQATQVVGFVVMILGWLLGFAPGFGTLANMYFVGVFADLIIEWGLIPIQNEIVQQLGLLLFGVAMLGMGSLFYLSAQLGAGPRDGLMLGLIGKLNKPVAYVRGAIEITALVLGYFLTGPVGIGTVITALTIGYSVQLFFRLGRFNSKSAQMDIYQLYNFLRSGKEKTATDGPLIT